MVADDERIEVRERTSATALWSDGERCHGVITDAGALGSRATVLATGGAAALWRRTTNPRGAIGAGPVFARGGGGRPRRPRVLPVPPDRARPPRHPLRRPADHRGDPRRGGEAARRRAASASPTSSPRATRSAPRSSPRCARRAAPRSASTCGRSTRPASPTSSPRSPRRASTRGAEPVPGLPRRPLHDGRHRGRPRRALLAARPLRGRRVLLHRPPRRQPAGLELAQRVLRLRRPGGARGARRARGRRRARRSPSGASSRRPAPPATPSGAAPARSATRPTSPA